MTGDQLVSALQELSDFERTLEVDFVSARTGYSMGATIELVEQVRVQAVDGRMVVCLRPA